MSIPTECQIHVDPGKDWSDKDKMNQELKSKMTEKVETVTSRGSGWYCWKAEPSIE